jgi:nitrate reductase gamma subunit
MLTFFKISVVGSLIFAIVSLTSLIIRTFSFGKRTKYAQPHGSIKRGIFFAFTSGMMPWIKESAKKHIITYLTGVLYHVGIFSALLILCLKLISVELPVSTIPYLQSVTILSLACGLGLFLKRLILPELKFISCLDDYVANLIVNLFLISTLAITCSNSFLPFFYIVSSLMLIYIPLGKIRHCFFFFYTRILFGLFFGRRRVFPPQTHIP